MPQPLLKRWETFVFRKGSLGKTISAGCEALAQLSTHDVDIERELELRVQQLATRIYVLPGQINHTQSSRVDVRVRALEMQTRRRY